MYIFGIFLFHACFACTSKFEMHTQPVDTASYTSVFLFLVLRLVCCGTTATSMTMSNYFYIITLSTSFMLLLSPHTTVVYLYLQVINIYYFNHRAQFLALFVLIAAFWVIAHSVRYGLDK